MSKPRWHPKEDAFADFCDQVTTRRSDTNPRIILSDYGQNLLAHVAQNESREVSGRHDTFAAWQFLRAILGYDSEYKRIELEVFRRDNPPSTFFSIDAINGFAKTRLVGIFHTSEVAKILDQSGSIFKRERGYLQSSRIERVVGNPAVARYQQVRSDLANLDIKQKTSVILRA